MGTYRVPQVKGIRYDLSPASPHSQVLTFRHVSYYSAGSQDPLGPEPMPISAETSSW